MRVAVTGTPGTGKTTATERVEADVPVVHLNDLIREADLYERVDEERDSLVADFEAIEEHLSADGLVESHLAHRLDADRVVVLRCHPAIIEQRLRARGESEATVTENAESEALDVILAEAVERHGAERVYEIETTDRTPEEVAAEIQAVIADERAPSAGTVNYTGYL